MPFAVVVGAGLSGATAARLLMDRGWRVAVFEKAAVVSGSCLDRRDESTGDMVHVYGPHAFHTNSPAVWEFVNRFDSFLPFALHVHAELASGKVIPIPFNEISRQVTGDWPTATIVDELFKTYSQKMWGVPWERLPGSVTGRVPKARHSSDSRYHLDLYQGIPVRGFKHMIEQMLAGAELHLGCSDSDWRSLPRDLLVYTGRAEEYFKLDPLPWRSLDFTFTKEKRTPFNQLNACHFNKRWHRQVDHSYWPNSKAATASGVELREVVVSREVAVPYVCGHNEPFYPEPHLANGRDAELWARCKVEPATLFVGRLATYRYINMDEAIQAVMKKLDRWLGERA